VNPKHRRTRASVALIGQEIALVDASPDLEFQLEREAIRQFNRIFITHWHFDHVWGLAALGEPSSLARWPPIEVYLPRQVVYHFDQELAHMRKRVNLHPIQPGDRFELPDATWEVVKTTHTDHSVGFIVESAQKFAYLVDGVIPPPETVERLKELDFLILESAVDELLLKEGERWENFSLQQAIDFWQQIEVDKCILTHLSCHSWRDNRLVAGLSYWERFEYEAKIPGLKFAYDGMRVIL
jgi:glyoxylase-like metal-dependent hydrolase (beta-lactamase superfamily II)